MIEIEASSGNVFADLGFSHAEEWQNRARLVARLSQTIAAKGLTQQQACKLIGLSQGKLSALLSGHFKGVSEAKLLQALARLGHRVQIVVSDETGDSGLPVLVFA